jgi:hypothetical protein
MVVECFCGGKMNLFSITEYNFSHQCIRYPKCLFCNSNKLDKTKFKGSSSNKFTHTILIYQCQCGLAHETHQKQSHILNERKRRPTKGKPLGIPCSQIALAYRHKLHEEIQYLVDKMHWTKDDIYSESSKILKSRIEEAHVGMLSISNCRKLIEYYQEIRGVD